MSKSRKHVSVTADTYLRLKEYAERQGVSMSAVVEALMADIGKEQDGEHKHQ